MAIELNKFQEKAVTYYGEKPLLVEAGPGSGKTRVIIERVKFLLNEIEIDPKSFLVITFSIKAANELKERLLEDDELDSEKVEQMQISTIHSFCNKILKDANKPYKIIDDDYGTKKNMFVLNHLEELGFEKESTLSRKEVGDVIKTFEKYTTFEVDIDGLIQWIEENEPVSQDYIDFINEEFSIHDKFPRKKIDLDHKDKKNGHGYKDSWYNAKHLQTAKAYKKYLELLKKDNYIDFNLLQFKALEHIKENPIYDYKNILVDEFQDTDPIQMEIIETLMNYAYSTVDYSKKDVLIKNKEWDVTFTAVGDVDQSIYGFRGALDDYFKYFYDNYDTKRISLNKNYRSTDEIIDLTEKFIKNQRGIESKKNLEGDRNESRQIYYLESEDRTEEANSLFEIIQNLVDNNIVKKYSDIGILYRSVTSSSGDLIDVLKENGVPYQISGLKGFDEFDEIRSFLTLLHYAIQMPSDDMPIFTTWEKDWLNLTAFCNINFEQKFVNLSSETQRILIEKEEEFRNDVFLTGKEVYKEETGKGCRKRSFNGILDIEDEILEKLFLKVKKPFLSVENLLDWGVRDEKDLEFFDKLETLRIEIFLSPYDDRPTILEIYYRILEISGFLNDEFLLDEKNEEIIKNIGFLTQIMYDYENIISNKDIRGLYWFLNANLRSYGPENESDHGINIMTVHKSKGLEFPVVIVASLNNDSFPKNYEDLSKMQYLNGSPVFYTPPEFMKIKNKKEDEVIQHCFEEERIIYVAMTRAQDLLILSKTNKKGRSSKYTKDLEEKLKELREFSRINNIQDEIEELKEREHIDKLADKIIMLEESQERLEKIYRNINKIIDSIDEAKEEKLELEDYLKALNNFLEHNKDDFDFNYENRILELLSYEFDDVNDSIESSENSDDECESTLQVPNSENEEEKSTLQIPDNENEEEKTTIESSNSENEEEFDIFEIVLDEDMTNILNCEIETIQTSIIEKEEFINENESEKLYQDKEEVKEKLSKLTASIKDLKEKEKFEDYEDIYDLDKQEEWRVIKELEEIEKTLNQKELNSNEFCQSLNEYKSDDLKELFDIKDDEINDKVNVQKEKVKYFFRIKAYEDISLIDELKERDNFSKKTQNLFKRIHYKNIEIEETKKMNQIERHKNLLNNLIMENNEIITKIDFNELDENYFSPEIENSRTVDTNDQIRLSYSSIERYESCPLQYNLNYNYKFRISDNQAISYGNISHNALEDINNLILENKRIYLLKNDIDEEDFDFSEGTNQLFISDNDIEKIVKTKYDESPNIDHSEEDRKEVIENIFAYWNEYGNSIEVLESEYPFEIDKEGYYLKGFIDLIYKTDDGIVILDYKTTDNVSDYKKKKYKKQLLTYALALKEDPKYKDLDVSNLQIYAINSQEMHDIDFNKDDLNNRKKDIEMIADNIHNGIYPKLDVSDGIPFECKYCMFKFICGVDKLIDKETMNN